MNYMQLNRFDTMNGSGCRVSLFVAGCTLACDGCFNRDAWNFNAGNKFTEEVKEQMMKYISHPDIDGVSILGGEPFADKNWKEVFELVKEIRERFPDKSILCYSGYTFDELIDTPKSAILDIIDILIDGRFEKDKVNTDLLYRGSSNQRILYHDKETNEWFEKEY